jgi:hypothetical protein
MSIFDSILLPEHRLPAVLYFQERCRSGQGFANDALQIFSARSKTHRQQKRHLLAKYYIKKTNQIHYWCPKFLTKSLLKSSHLKEETLWSAVAVISGGDVFYSLVAADHDNAILAQSKSDKVPIPFGQVGPNQVAVTQCLQQHPELWVATYQGEPSWTLKK